MNSQRRISVVIPVFWLICALFSFSQSQEKSVPAEGITVEELRDHIYFLASDFLAGRKTASPGFQMAAEYAASQFQAAGLKQVLKDENGKPAFFRTCRLFTKYSTLKAHFGQKARQDLVQKFFEGEDYGPFRFSGTGLKEDYRRFELKHTTAGLTVAYKQTPAACRNVIAAVPGTDPRLAQQVMTC